MALLARTVRKAPIRRAPRAAAAERAAATVEVRLGETPVIALPEGALLIPGAGALIVADLHFEKASAFARTGQMLPPYDTRATLARLTALITAHRPGIVVSLGDAFHDGGVVRSELRLGALRLRHEPTGEAGEIAGHLHPCAKVAGRGASVRRRCFALDDARMVMPAFGAFAGGLNICDAAFAAVFPDGAAALVLGRAKVMPVHWSRLMAD